MGYDIEWYGGYDIEEDSKNGVSKLHGCGQTSAYVCST